MVEPRGPGPRQTAVVNAAKSNIGSTEWRKWGTRLPLTCTEDKCNLFVSEMLAQGGVAVPLVHKSSNRCILSNFRAWWNDLADHRPPTASEWFDKNWNMPHPNELTIVSHSNCWPGDIISDGGHMGIISGVRKTISHSYHTQTVVENDWGWREGGPKVIIRRYHS